MGHIKDVIEKDKQIDKDLKSSRRVFVAAAKLAAMIELQKIKEGCNKWTPTKKDYA